MARRQHQSVLRDQRHHFGHFREQFTITRDTDKWAILLRAPHLIFRAEGGYSYEASPSSRDLGHVCHSRGIDSTDGEIQVDSAQHFQTGYFLPDQVCQSTRRIVVVLEDNSAHALRTRKLRHIERVNGPRPAVRIAVNVDIDRPSEHSICVVRPDLLSRNYRRY